MDAARPECVVEVADDRRHIARRIGSWHVPQHRRIPGLRGSIRRHKVETRRPPGAPPPRSFRAARPARTSSANVLADGHRRIQDTTHHSQLDDPHGGPSAHLPQQPQAECREDGNATVQRRQALPAASTVLRNPNAECCDQSTSVRGTVVGQTRKKPRPIAASTAAASP